MNAAGFEPGYFFANKKTGGDFIPPVFFHVFADALYLPPLELLELLELELLELELLELELLELELLDPPPQSTTTELRPEVYQRLSACRHALT